MNYRFEIFLDNFKENLKKNWKKILLAFSLIAVIVLLVLILLNLKGGKSEAGISKKEYKNTLALAQVYADKNEYDRALARLEKLLIERKMKK